MKKNQKHLQINECKIKEAKELYIKEIKQGYEPFAIHKYDSLTLIGEERIYRIEQTMHEGEILYHKYWNYWIRDKKKSDNRTHIFFPDFENSNSYVLKMINDIGFSLSLITTEKDIWERIAAVWLWLVDNVTYDATEYSTISTHMAWPSIENYASYYQNHGYLVWASCFSRAHLFATILGRVGIPRWRIAIVESHHTEGGAPPTASHAFVAIYLANQWFYFDPTFVFSLAEFPDYQHKCSVGLLDTVDYEHPFQTIPIPLSNLNQVPLLKGAAPPTYSRSA